MKNKYKTTGKTYKNFTQMILDLNGAEFLHKMYQEEYFRPIEEIRAILCLNRTPDDPVIWDVNDVQNKELPKLVKDLMDENRKLKKQLRSMMVPNGKE